MMIKVEGADGRPTWINAAQVTSVRTTEDGTTELTMTNGDHIPVKDVPERLIERLRKELTGY